MRGSIIKRLSLLTVLSLLGMASNGVSAQEPSGYPVQDVLSAFGDVCFDKTASSYQPLPNAEAWKQIAKAKGWEEISQAPATASKGLRAYYRAKALNWDLFSSMGAGGGGPQPTMPVEALYQKLVGGRDVFLSIVAIDADNPVLAECRLRDPLGDGVLKLPVLKTEIERWIGKSVKTSRGWFGGQVYRWEGRYPTNSIRVHFGFDRKWLDGKVRKYDPYAQYGMTLVRSDYEQIIVT